MKIGTHTGRNGSNMLTVDDIVAGQTPNIVPLFEEEIPKFDNIIEIGTSLGALTLLLNYLKKEEASLISYDISERRVQIFGRGIDVRIGDCFKLVDEIAEEIQKEGRTILLCDGGKKNQEVNTFAQYLKSDDVIACHDYEGGRFGAIGREIIWKFGSESKLKHIESTLKKHSLEGYRYEEFENVLWGCWRKK